MGRQLLGDRRRIERKETSGGSMLARKRVATSNPFNPNRGADPFNEAQQNIVRACARYIVADDVARAGANHVLLRLVERIGASVWVEGIRGRNAFPSQHAAARGLLAFDAAAIAKQLAPHDLVLMVGGPFFEEIWYAPGSPFAAGTRVLQIEEAGSRLAYNFVLDAGVLSAVGPALEIVESAIESALATGDHARGDLLSGRLYAGRAFQQCGSRASQPIEGDESRRRCGAGSAPEPASRAPTSMPRAMAEIRRAHQAMWFSSTRRSRPGRDLFKAFPFAGPDDYFSGRGGGTGQGLAGAIGVAVAQNQRPVLCLSGKNGRLRCIRSRRRGPRLVHDLLIVFVILAMNIPGAQTQY